MNENESRSVFYDKSHQDIVKNGIEAISDVLNGDNMADKESLLLCLDKYLDPWFGYKLPYESQIFDLIEQVVVNYNTKAVKEDALNLLTSYSYPPFIVLENNLDKIEDSLMPDVLYAINMDKEFELS